MHSSFLTCHDCHLEKLKEQSHNTQIRRSGEIASRIFETYKIMYNLMVVIFTTRPQTWPWLQGFPVAILIMGYCTGNVCYIVVINYQVLSYPFRSQIKIQQTRFQQFVFLNQIFLKVILQAAK